ncbi:MAG: DNA-directed RNA polymerase subunit omega [Acidimicrobiales bacterium]|jgi:DNA-directed RNA polymerase subunit omega
MALRRTTLIDPPIEDLLDKVDSKFTLVSLSAKRARQINAYYNQLGEGMGMVVPPQVASVSGKPLTIAFEEIAAAKTTYHHPEPGAEEAEGDEAPDGAGESSVVGSDESSVSHGAAGDDATEREESERTVLGAGAGRDGGAPEPRTVE